MTRLLIIEDNPANLDLMSYLLQAFGYTPITASSGEEGLDAAHREVPDLILCDIHLPGIDGHEIARQVKRDSVLRAIPLVAVTALAMVGDRDKVLASGFDGYLAKPIAPETFVKQVETFLRPHQRMTCPRPIPAEEAPMIQMAIPPHKGLVILIVDDSPINIALYSSLFESSGYAVIAAENITDGMRFANLYIPDVIVSDVHIRKESGYEFCKRIKSDRRLRSIPFVFLSSTAMNPDDRMIALALGADSFLVRPIEPPLLLATIEALLSKHGTGNEEASLTDNPSHPRPSGDD